MYFKKRFEAKKHEAAPKEVDAGLDDETYWGIIKNYSDLYAKYGG